MKTELLSGNWNLIKGKLKKKYGQLTENDLTYVEGEEDELLGRLQRKTGQTREELERFLDEGTDTIPSSGTRRNDLGGDQPGLNEVEQGRQSETRRAI
jgi:uncharacterized protein YjbJ (UPF0337 family)